MNDYFMAEPPNFNCWLRWSAQATWFGSKDYRHENKTTSTNVTEPEDVWIA